MHRAPYRGPSGETPASRLARTEGTGARLALSIAEPNTGDFLIKLKPDRQRKTSEVIAELRAKLEVDPERPRHLLTVRGSGYRFVTD